MFKQHGPAPVPADGLAAALAPFGQSRMLPREAYVDPAVFEWEQRNIFSGWTCVGHASDLAGVGAQRAVGERPERHAVGARRRRHRPRVREYLQAPRTRIAGVRRNRQAAAASSARTTRGRTGWTAGCAMRPASSDVEGFDPGEFGLAELRLVELARLAVRRPQRRRRRIRRTRRGFGGRRRAVPARGPDDRGAALLRARHQLEGDRRELPGVLPLLDDPSGAVPDQPADQRREPRTRGLLDGRLDVDRRRAPRPCH